MLNHQAVFSYLIQQKLLAPESLILDRLRIVNSSQRNHNVSVLRSHSPSYFLKQGDGGEGSGTVANEALVYQFLQTQRKEHEIHNYLPRCLGYDSQEQILTLELVADARDLGKYHMQLGRFPKSMAVAMGKALGVLHQVPVKDKVNYGSEWLTHEIPWVITLHRPELKLLKRMSNTALKVIKIIQKFPNLCTYIDVLSQEWNPVALIHYDIKLENYLVYPQKSEKQSTGLKMIDWEFAGIGDPCWDVGSVFSTYLSFWIFSMPITGETPPEEFMKLARYPLERMKGAFISFWTSYVNQMALAPVEANSWLLKSMRFAAARLLQTAYEIAMSRGRLTNNVVCLLQVSFNILQRPEQATLQLLGIPFQ
jgi:Predicted aminoglycoside phosphotransferase